MPQDDRNLKGFDELSKNIARVKAATGVKVMRQSASASVTPTIKHMRAKAPKGDEAHRTYKGRLVAPGFLSRSIKRRSWWDKDEGKAIVIIGVAAEAWYGLLYDQGFRRGKRDRSVKQASRTQKGGLSGSDLDSLGDSRKTVPGSGWFSDTFVQDSRKMPGLLARAIGKRLDKIRAKKR